MTEPSAPAAPSASTPGSPATSRRTVLACASVTCAAVLAGCARYDSNNGGIAAGQPAYTPPAPSSSGAGSSSAGGGGAAANVLAKTSDVPVGGGKILTDKKIVITQPKAGAFHAFTAVCTHAGCIVDQVASGTIDCPCHGSKFSATNGSVVNGPAASPLAAVNIKVKGTNIVQA